MRCSIDEQLSLQYLSRTVLCGYNSVCLRICFTRILLHTYTIGTSLTYIKLKHSFLRRDKTFRIEASLELESWVKSAISIPTPTDHVQMVTSWCEIKRHFVVTTELETVRLPGRLSRYFINSTNDRERSDNSWWPTDCTAIYFLPWARQRDSCRQLQGMTFFCIPTLALYFASDLNTHCKSEGKYWSESAPTGRTPNVGVMVTPL